VVVGIIHIASYNLRLSYLLQLIVTIGYLVILFLNWGVVLFHIKLGVHVDYITLRFDIILRVFCLFFA